MAPVTVRQWGPWSPVLEQRSGAAVTEAAATLVGPPVHSRGPWSPFLPWRVPAELCRPGTQRLSPSCDQDTAARLVAAGCQGSKALGPASQLNRQHVADSQGIPNTRQLLGSRHPSGAWVSSRGWKAYRKGEGPQRHVLEDEPVWARPERPLRASGLLVTLRNLHPPRRAGCAVPSSCYLSVNQGRTHTRVCIHVPCTRM